LPVRAAVAQASSVIPRERLARLGGRMITAAPEPSKRAAVSESPWISPGACCFTWSP
jgi:hypothetical protein